MRKSIRARFFPIELSGHAISPIALPLAVERPIGPEVCDLVARYEAVLERAGPKRSELVVRGVLESSRINAPLLPLCPTPEESELLPSDEIDCVACVLDCDVSVWRYACYVLRVQGRPGLITAEVYMATAPKTLGLVPMQIRNILWLVFALLTGSNGSVAPAPDAAALAEANEHGGKVLHFVQSALEMACQPLVETSARDRIVGNRSRRSVESPQAAVENESSGPSPSPSAEPSEDVPRIEKKVKRRGEGP